MTEKQYTKSRLAQLDIAIVLLVLFAGLLLTLQSVFSEDDDDKPTYSTYEEYNDLVEPLCKDHGGQLDVGSGECIFDERDDDENRAKATIFEKELEDRGLLDDYTAEEEASWNQNQQK